MGFEIYGELTLHMHRRVDSLRVGGNMEVAGRYYRASDRLSISAVGSFIHGASDS